MIDKQLAKKAQKMACLLHCVTQTGMFNSEVAASMDSTLATALGRQQNYLLGTLLSLKIFLVNLVILAMLRGLPKRHASKSKSHHHIIIPASKGASVITSQRPSKHREALVRALLG